MTNIQDSDIGVKLRPAPAAELLELTAQFGRTKEAGGAIKSQYAKELATGDESVGTLGVYGCGKLLGGMTFGFHRIPTTPDEISARIDVVVTRPEARGVGLAAIVVSSFAVAAADGNYGPTSHISVICQHPSITGIVSEMGFESVDIGSAPLYQIKLEGKPRANLLRRGSQLKTVRLARLRAQCRSCPGLGSPRAWCGGEKP